MVWPSLSTCGGGCHGRLQRVGINTCGGGDGCHPRAMSSVRWWVVELSGMLTHHESTVQTDHVTHPSPAKTGTGMSRVIFFSPVPVPVTPVPVIPHGFAFPCPSLSQSATAISLDPSK